MLSAKYRFLISSLLVHHPKQRIARQEPAQVPRVVLVMALPHLFGQASNVRSNQDILHLPQRRVLRERLLGGDIERRATEALRAQRIHQRSFVKEDTATYVDQICIGLQPAETPGIHQVTSLGPEI